jgi:hypothetical protein
VHMWAGALCREQAVSPGISSRTSPGSEVTQLLGWLVMLTPGSAVITVSCVKGVL